MRGDLIQVMYLEDHEVIFRQSDEAHLFYIILHGTVSIWQASELAPWGRVWGRWPPP